MKKNFLFILFLAGLSAASGYLMSNMSWIGRVGVNLVHHEYKFLKVWWQGGLAVFAGLMVLYMVHYIMYKALPIWLSRLLHLMLMGAAGYGFYFTWQDFSDDFTHHIIKSRFHIGAYLFWVGWVLICLFFLPKKRKLNLKDLDKKVPSNS